MRNETRGVCVVCVSSRKAPISIHHYCTYLQVGGLALPALPECSGALTDPEGHAWHACNVCDGCEPEGAECSLPRCYSFNLRRGAYREQGAFATQEASSQRQRGRATQTS